MVLDSNEQKALADLKRKRGVVKASLTRIAKFVDSYDPTEQSILLLDFRQEELPLINRKFDTIQSEIELLAVDEAEAAEAEIDKFETSYYELRAKIQELANAEKLHNTTGQNTSFGNTSTRQRMQLAPIPLPKFNGDIQGWSSFYDVYRAAVHDDDCFTPAQKLYYLRSCLREQALDLVQSIPISDGNYEVVLSRLKQRYDNKSLVIQSHIRSILEMPAVEEASANALQRLHSNVSTHVAALRTLGQPVDHWDAWLITIITSRLDKGTGHSWQLHLRNTELPAYKDLEAFLASRCVAMESSETVCPKTSSTKLTNINNDKTMFSKTHQPTKKVLISTNNRPVRQCPCCSESHRLFACEQFKALPVTERLGMARASQLCFNCLGPFHSAESCRSTYTCQRCKRKHNTLLHYEKPNTVGQISVPDQAKSNIATTSSQELSHNVACPAQGGKGHVFLSTASVLAEDQYGEFKKCRVILDNGSQMNFVSKSFANLLQLPRNRTILPISGIGANRTQSVSRIAVKVKSRVKQFEVDLVCHILPIVIDALPSCSKPKGGWEIPEELVPQLADPSFDSTGSVDLLIGGGIFYDLIEPARIRSQRGAVCLQDSKFGWLVTGEVGTISLLATCSIGEACEDNLRILSNYESEVYGVTSKPNKKCIEEQKALKHFEETARRDETGRFVLRLPLKSDARTVGRTLEMATARFLSVERRLQREPELRLQYTQFMEEYLKMGHMKIVSKEESQPSAAFYLPHHPVMKLSSLTTKLRVVFDASAKSTSNLSLNDVLLCGPTVQDDLVTILMRFRKHQVVITADVEKMFRQIRVAEEDQDWQRIVWRSPPDKALELYRLATVTYGTTSASFMATNCLVSLSEEAKQKYPEASKIIRHDFYMDDLMTGASTVDECCQLQKQIDSILESAHLPLRKWCSNSTEVLERIGDSSDDPLFALQIGEDEIIKSLGLSWKPALDAFQFIVEQKAFMAKSTKRTLLSDLNRIFDPLGFLAPVLVRGKIFLQQLWQLKIEWDQQLPEELSNRWYTFYQEFNDLSYLPIPRKCIPYQSVEVEIHGFCDASEEAYGSAIYVRSKDCTGYWHSRLLCARTRVAPLKGSTIPRLELGGALTLTQLSIKVSEALEMDVKKFYLWTDSMVVLGWLNSQTCRLKTFVANRVEEILETTQPEQWRHVATSENPADILSRGTTPNNLQSMNLWWQGPHWLASESDEFKKSIITNQNQDLPEQRKIKLALLAVNPLGNLFQHYSNWRNLLCAVAWISRFLRYLKAKKNLDVPKYLTVSELKSAEITVLKHVQKEVFAREMLELKKGNDVGRKSKLKGLSPYLEDGLILVGERLGYAQIPERQKHPIVLPNGHRVSKLIFESKHRELLHCGPQSLLADIRRVYWPIKGRITARSVISKCVRCARAKPQFAQPLMGQLPRQRVNVSPPFAVTGVDFAGPLIVRSGVRRIVGTKAWISLFVCFSTRAIHLEVVENLSSGAFVAALRRFMAQRGRCVKIYSDNGTNFVGAQKELNIPIHQSIPVIAKEGVEWHFNPPSAPHFGGLWESAVKSAKHHLTRMLGEAKLTIGELNTLLCQIEACLNSRPITPMGHDPSEPEALTPAHFLIGRPITLMPEVDLTQENPGGMRRWKYVQHLSQTFWKRWHAEYLPQMQVRGKWITKKGPLKIDDIVIIKEDHVPPTKWKLGRVIKVHPGVDGEIRVVTVRIGSGTEMKRPTVKLCRLPTDKDINVDENEELVEK
ncbi:uncharacterized protein LOC103309405 [Acyrthosiphon pisum]|uniref:Integrase catalytic domain-containing protein n=1 Tax=Acyrthosiphon pisum TaxID=7029 RepID=A0A8R2B5Q3_ACYPI|nr:uncharacterized protein LOC103309405 [Acyrthosiphon pisum]|eukprot:XP_008182965.1 PREDICTED: uncharacterized protein LOC103309405 [Acyrthosiphon pisum]